MTQKKGTESNEGPKLIGKEINLFIRNIDSLQETMPLTSVMIAKSHIEATEELDRFVDSFCHRREDNGRHYIEVDRPNVEEFEKLYRRVGRFSIASRTVPRSFVVSLVSHYDFFLGRLLRAFLLLKPDLLKASERTLTLSQMLEFGSFEEAKEYVIEKEVETFLRKSHSEQFEILEKKFDLPLRKNLPIWGVFVEVTERRNLFVHTGGVISRQYIKVCRDNDYVVGDDLKVGGELEAPVAYFNLAYQAIFEIGVKLGQVLWRKVFPDDIGSADSNIGHICYDLLREEKNELARTLLDFATGLKKHGDEQTRRVFVVNRAQAYKWLGNDEEATKIIKSEDWSAASDDFKLAEAVLTDDFATAANIMKKIGDNGVPSKIDYKDWPLFKKFRLSDDFLQAYEQVFGEPYREAGMQVAEGSESPEMPNAHEENTESTRASSEEDTESTGASA
jgi:hypothetical protein